MSATGEVKSCNVCFFCRNRANSIEHLWGKWLLKVSGLTVKPTDRRDHKTSFVVFDPNNPLDLGEQRNGIFAQTGLAMQEKRRVVCKICNNTFMSAIENRSRKRFADCLRWERTPEARDYFDMALWFSLKTALFSHSIVMSEGRGKLPPVLSQSGKDAIKSLSIPDELSIGYVEMLPGSGWAFHNLQYIAYPSVSETQVFLAASFGGVGFLATNHAPARQTLRGLASKHPRRVSMLSPQTLAEQTTPLIAGTTADLELLLRELLPANRPMRSIAHGVLPYTNAQS